MKNIILLVALIALSSSLLSCSSKKNNNGSGSAPLTPTRVQLQNAQAVNLEQVKNIFAGYQENLDTVYMGMRWVTESQSDFEVKNRNDSFVKCSTKTVTTNTVVEITDEEIKTLTQEKVSSQCAGETQDNKTKEDFVLVQKKKEAFDQDFQSTPESYKFVQGTLEGRPYLEVSGDMSHEQVEGAIVAYFDLSRSLLANPARISMTIVKDDESIKNTKVETLSSYPTKVSTQNLNWQGLPQRMDED